MVSIIIPTLNEEKYLPRLLHSIKSQGISDYEVIIADAGSTDRTITIAKEQGCKVTPGGLPAKGRNEGAKVAKGDILLFLDADLILPEQFLPTALSIFAKRNLGIAGFPVLPYGGIWIDAVACVALNIFSFVTQKFIPYTACAIMAKKSVHQTIGGFNEKILFIEDYPYGKAASKVAKYGFMRTLPFYTSARRFEKDGRLNVYGKYVLGQLYMLFFGPITTNIFHYQFNHYNDTKK